MRNHTIWVKFQKLCMIISKYNIFTYNTSLFDLSFRTVLISFSEAISNDFKALINDLAESLLAKYFVFKCFLILLSRLFSLLLDFFFSTTGSAMILLALNSNLNSFSIWCRASFTSVAVKSFHLVSVDCSEK